MFESSQKSLSNCGKIPIGESRDFLHFVTYFTLRTTSFFCFSISNRIKITEKLCCFQKIHRFIIIFLLHFHPLFSAVFSDHSSRFCPLFRCSRLHAVRLRGDITVKGVVRCCQSGFILLVFHNIILQVSKALTSHEKVTDRITLCSLLDKENKDTSLPFFENDPLNCCYPILSQPLETTVVIPACVPWASFIPEAAVRSLLPYSSVVEAESQQVNRIGQGYLKCSRCALRPREGQSITALDMQRYSKAPRGIEDLPPISIRHVHETAVWTDRAETMLGRQNAPLPKCSWWD